MIQAQGWHLGDAEQLGGEQPAMAGDDVAVAVGQNRDNEAEKLDAVGNLPNLLFAVAPRIGRIQLELFYRPVNNHQGNTWR